MTGTLKQARLAKHITQKSIASAVGIGDQHYQAIEYGKVEPSVVLAIRIAEVLSVYDYTEFKALFPPRKQDHKNNA